MGNSFQIEENKATIINSLHIENGITVLGDSHQGFPQTLVKQSRLKGLDYLSSDIPLPSISEELFKVIKKQRILVINNNFIFDPIGLGKAMAQNLIANKQVSKASEYFPNDSTESIINDLYQFKPKQFIVLNDIKPIHFQMNFDRLISLSEQKESIYLVYTNTPLKTWEKSSLWINDFWFEMPDQIQYEQSELGQWFISHLISSTSLFESIIEPPQLNSLLGTSININAIVKQLETPENLYIFINRIRHLTLPIPDQTIETILARFKPNTNYH